MISPAPKLSTFLKEKVNSSAWLRKLTADLRSRHCLLCQATHQQKQGICVACQDDLPWLGAGCNRCGLPLLAAYGTSICAQCQQHPPVFDQCLGLFAYEFPVRELIAGFKFRDQHAYGGLLGALLAESVQQHYGSQLPTLIVPAPLHPRRRRERGFNQAEELAANIRRHTKMPIDPQLCKKVRATPAQSSLDAHQRARNLRGVFEVRRVLQGEHILLVDDIVTTGHTANELSRVLKIAGAGRIDVWCIARTPAPV